MNTRKPKESAAALVRLLTESAIALSHTDPATAKQQAALARKVKLKFNVRLEPPLRAFTCRGCKGLLVPGVNARVRLGHGKPTILRVTCLDCGRVNRKIVETA
ncbi:MAG: RNase P subunit [Nitrososphaerota archaeon]|nr:RNase P subunit [Nitrososphaerota archaeon]